MGVDPLDEACTLAFEVARHGVEASPPVDPPTPMRNYLYVAQLPRRAMSVARQVIDDDTDFRSRVAGEATEDRVGRAGMLWLERPDGWEAELGSLISEPGPAAPTPPPPPPAPESPRRGPMPADERPAPPPAPDLDASQDDIETELASLRDLVDRLADERQSVDATVEGVGIEVEERRVESMTGATEIGAERDEVGAELDQARVDRQEAQTDKDEAVARQAALEQELGELRIELVEVRRQLGEIERGQTAAETALATAETAVASLEARISELEDERQELRLQLDLVSAERDEATQTLAELQDDRDGLTERVGVAEQARLDAEAEMEDMTSKYQDLQTQVGDLGEQKSALEAELEELRQLQESSERARRELSHDLGAQLERAEAERDLLASKLQVAQERLGGTRTALDSATTNIGSELDGADEAFTETLRAAADLEQVFDEAAERINELEAEGFDSAEAGTPGEVPDEAESPAGEGTGASEPSASPEHPRRGTELEEVLASYGLGAEPADGEDEQPPETATDEASKAREGDDGTPRTGEPDTERLPAGATTPESAVPLERTSARRQITPITGDPVDVARHAVSTADVVLLLDGDPIASLGWPTLEVADRRDALVSYLGDLAAETGAASDVVFDGRVGDETNLPVSRAVRVRLTNIEVEPTTAIAELVDDYPTQWPVAVVSDDSTLTERATARGATVLDNGQLLDLFISN